MNNRPTSALDNRGIESLIFIPKNNLYAHNLLPALFKYFDIQIDNY